MKNRPPQYGQQQEPRIQQPMMPSMQGYLGSMNPQQTYDQWYQREYPPVPQGPWNQQDSTGVYMDKYHPFQLWQNQTYPPVEEIQPNPGWTQRNPNEVAQHPFLGEISQGMKIAAMQGQPYWPPPNLQDSLRQNYGMPIPARRRIPIQEYREAPMIPLGQLPK